jgi:threonine aldolase
LGEILGKLSVVSEIIPVATNIVIARLQGTTPEEFMKKLADKDIKSVKFGKDLVRFVTHLDFDDVQLEEFGRRIGKI